MSQKWTLEKYQERISIFFPHWQYDIISFQGMKKPCIITCKLCGQQITLNQANYLFNRNTPCSCYTEFSDYKAKVIYLGQYFDFSMVDVDKAIPNKITTCCNRCGTFQIRSMTQIAMTPSHCPNCDNYAATREAGISKEEAEQRLKTFDENYTLLEYQEYSKPALLRHSCGFIFKTTKLAELINGHNKGCPKCNSTKAKANSR